MRILRFGILISILLLRNNSISLFAQTKDSLRKEAISHVLFRGCNFSLYFSYYSAQKAKILPKSGEYKIRSSRVGGIEIGGNWSINFNKNYSIITGIHGGASGRNASLFIPKTDFSPNLKRHANMPFVFGRDYDLYLSLPVWFERRWENRNFNQWNLIAGINIRYYPDDIFYIYTFDEQDVNNQFIEVFDMEGEVWNDYSPWVNYNIGGGYSFFLSNYNFLRINFIANLSTNKLAKFNYTINVTGKPPSTGTYTANLSYFGLSISYIFTGSNRKLVKLYRKRFQS